MENMTAPSCGSQSCRSHSWLDHLAIGMAAVCAVHCLLTPLLLVALPIIATTFFVHEDFHVWMLFAVIPTTSFAVFMGCRKHKDRWVVALSAVGLSLLLAALVFERLSAGASIEAAHCAACAGEVAGHSASLLPWINCFGGLFLASGHVRNFRLCRLADCQHR
jgi:carbon starvation protein CstA